MRMSRPSCVTWTHFRPRSEKQCLSLAWKAILPWMLYEEPFSSATLSLPFPILWMTLARKTHRRWVLKEYLASCHFVQSFVKRVLRSPVVFPNFPSFPLPFCYGAMGTKPNPNVSNLFSEIFPCICGASMFIISELWLKSVLKETNPESCMSSNWHGNECINILE